MVEHRLKTRPIHFERVVLGYKRYTIRINDRGFQIGDTIVKAEYDPAGHGFTGRTAGPFRVISLTKDVEGLKPGFVVLGFEPIPLSGERTLNIELHKAKGTISRLERRLLAYEESTSIHQFRAAVDRARKAEAEVRELRMRLGLDESA